MSHPIDHSTLIFVATEMARILRSTPRLQFAFTGDLAVYLMDEKDKAKKAKEDKADAGEAKAKDSKSAGGKANDSKSKGSVSVPGIVVTNTPLEEEWNMQDIHCFLRLERPGMHQVHKALERFPDWSWNHDDERRNSICTYCDQNVKVHWEGEEDYFRTPVKDGSETSESGSSSKGESRLKWKIGSRATQTPKPSMVETDDENARRRFPIMFDDTSFPKTKTKAFILDPISLYRRRIMARDYNWGSSDYDPIRLLLDQVIKRGYSPGNLVPDLGEDERKAVNRFVGSFPDTVRREELRGLIFAISLPSRGYRE